MTSLDEARRNAWGLAGLCLGMGALHFARPEPFDALIPRCLPGIARQWTFGSGMAELAIGTLLAVPATRRAGGRAAQALFIGVFPGNLTMAWRWRRRPWPQRLVSWARLPLQADLVQRAGLVARHG
ncbi:DoxX family protein [Actinomyces radicidentis]|uniref:DoxX family protein n=1 Tax=Actinomyces radicidentis TaxID=111015 RepID=UPI0026DEAD22|nr:hypothetical protein [Actinomyces radicidentis]